MAKEPKKPAEPEKPVEPENPDEFDDPSIGRFKFTNTTVPLWPGDVVPDAFDPDAPPEEEPEEGEAPEPPEGAPV